MKLQFLFFSLSRLTTFLFCILRQHIIEEIRLNKCSVTDTPISKNWDAVQNANKKQHAIIFRQTVFADYGLKKCMFHAIILSQSDEPLPKPCL